MKQEAACSRVDGLVDEIAALQDEVSSLQVSSLTSPSTAGAACHVMLPACLLQCMCELHLHPVRKLG